MQVIDGPDGTFDNVRTHASYSVPYYAITQWTMASQYHIDQVNVEFYLGAVYGGTIAAGGSSNAQVGVYKSGPPTNGQFDSTRMTGNWIDKDPSHTTPDDNVTFTATADSHC